MALTLAAKQAITVGEPVVIEAGSRVDDLAIVFEDDGEAGYCYAVSVEGGELRILDAVHIYTVVDVSDREIPATIQLLWDDVGPRAALLVNDRPHAVFDFAARRGYCRDAYPEPPSDSDWVRPDWDEQMLESLVTGTGHA